jgi:hypothetical protein
MYMHRAPTNIEGGRFASVAMADLVARHKLNGEKTTVTLHLSDPFNTMRFRLEAGDDHIIQLTERTSTFRALHLTLQYNSGKAPKVRRPQPQQTEEQGAGFP